MQQKSEIKVVVADSDISKVRNISRVLNSDNKIAVVAQVSSEKRVHNLINDLQADLLILGTGFLKKDLMYIIREVMAKDPLPIIIAAKKIPSEQKKALDAVASGALEIFDYSLFSVVNGKQVCEKIRVLAGIRVIHHISPFKTEIGRKKNMTYYVGPPVLAIAASTGGPKIISRLLRSLPLKLNFTIIIVQHIPGDFTKSFTEWLITETGRDVRILKNNDLLQKDVVHIAPGGFNTFFSKAGFIRLDPKEGRDSSPSADLLFSSLKNAADKVIALVLTGMGEDGARGMKDLKDAGAYTLIQDPEDALVDGMPGACLRSGAGVKLTVEEMPLKILTYVVEINRRFGNE